MDKKKRNRRAYSLRDRLLGRVVKIPVTGCWIYSGRYTAAGYGVISRNGRTITKENPRIYAHRASWEIHNGPIPEGKNILHHCDVRACVNPAHLFCGDQKDNALDALHKGRLTQIWKKGEHIGENNAFAKLTAAQVFEIRMLYNAQEMSTQAIADKFGLGTTQVKRIAKGQAWTHTFDKKLKPTSLRPHGWEKGDTAGEKNNATHLTNREVMEIRDLCKHRVMTHLEIGKLYGASRPVVDNISRGATWKSLN